ncbi:MAG: histidine phosphatase family protein [Aristaeellaceae bacterium]
MRTIYLIRHGRALQREGVRRCIGRTDLPLSPEGEGQAEALAIWLEAHPARVYASPLARARDTALRMAGSRGVTVLDALAEVDVGLWEGLTFEEIRLRWPEHYAERGLHLASCAPPEGESFLEGGARLMNALEGILRDTEGDVALVSHSGVIRGLLCRLMPMDPDALMTLPQPCGGVTTLREEAGSLTVVSVGVMPSPVPPDADIRRWHRRQETPEQVVAHEEAVTRRALLLSEQSGAPVNQPLLRAACLLHDLCRTAGRSHPAEAANALRAEGYPALADIVARHHDLGDAPCPEAELLYLADKLTGGTEPVTLEERFRRAREKCRTPEALAAWQARYDQALALERRYTHHSKGDAQP